MYGLRALVTCILLTSAICCHAQEQAQAPRTRFIDWAKQNAIELASPDGSLSPGSMRSLASQLGDARVVGLGDSRHDAKEQFEMKIELIKAMVTEMGFNIIALEESFPYAQQINHYIGGGEGNLGALMNRMGAWYIWDTEEIRLLILWLKEHNRTAPKNRQVTFAGLDITDPLCGLQVLSDYLSEHDPATASLLGQIDFQMYRVETWQGIVGNYASADPGLLSQIGDTIDQVVLSLEQKPEQLRGESGAQEYEWALSNARSLAAGHDTFTKMVSGNVAVAGDARERGMLQNLLWHLQSKGPDSRAIVWAHNFHVGKGQFDLAVQNGAVISGLVPVGKYIADSLEGDYLSIGMSFAESDYGEEELPSTAPETIDGTLAEVGPDIFAIDLRTVPDGSKTIAWATSSQQIRGQGQLASLSMTQSYDMMIFIRKITPSTATVLARERRRSQLE